MLAAIIKNSKETEKRSKKNYNPNVNKQTYQTEGKKIMYHSYYGMGMKMRLALIPTLIAFVIIVYDHIFFARDIHT